MRILLPVFIPFLIIQTVAAQSEGTAIRKVVDQVFTGMEKSDSAMVRAAFARDVAMASAVRNKNNEPILVKESSLDGWLKAIASPKKDAWREVIWNVKINIDGDLASVWCDYAFYVGKTFSHCGIDAFLLHKTSEGWKIFSVADTRRKEACDVPEEVKRRYE